MDVTKQFKMDRGRGSASRGSHNDRGRSRGRGRGKGRVSKSIQVVDLDDDDELCNAALDEYSLSPEVGPNRFLERLKQIKSATGAKPRKSFQVYSQDIMDRSYDNSKKELPNNNDISKRKANTSLLFPSVQTNQCLPKLNIIKTINVSQLSKSPRVYSQDIMERTYDRDEKELPSSMKQKFKLSSLSGKDRSNTEELNVVGANDVTQSSKHSPMYSQDIMERTHDSDDMNLMKFMNGSKKKFKFSSRSSRIEPNALPEKFHDEPCRIPSMSSYDVMKRSYENNKKDLCSTNEVSKRPSKINSLSPKFNQARQIETFNQNAKATNFTQPSKSTMPSQDFLERTYNSDESEDAFKLTNVSKRKFKFNANASKIEPNRLKQKFNDIKTTEVSEPGRFHPVHSQSLMKSGVDNNMKKLYTNNIIFKQPSKFNSLSPKVNQNRHTEKLNHTDARNITLPCTSPAYSQEIMEVTHDSDIMELPSSSKGKFKFKKKSQPRPEIQKDQERLSSPSPTLSPILTLPTVKNDLFKVPSNSRYPLSVRNGVSEEDDEDNSPFVKKRQNSGKSKRKKTPSNPFIASQAVASSDESENSFGENDEFEFDGLDDIDDSFVDNDDDIGVTDSEQVMYLKSVKDSIPLKFGRVEKPLSPKNYGSYMDTTEEDYADDSFCQEDDYVDYMEVGVFTQAMNQAKADLAVSNSGRVTRRGKREAKTKTDISHKPKQRRRIVKIDDSSDED